MNSTQSELWTRLEAFVFDEPGTTLTFARRLARENDWTAEFTQRVIREYKRFVFLAMEAGHPVSPSEEVDQAWHLHLTYTKSYWQDLCGEVLGGRRLHHHPTKGGSDEAAKFDGQYQRTLDSYRRLFGEEPPPDIWIPAGERRHAKGGKHRWVDTKRYWLVPKWIIWAGAASAGALAAVVAVSGCSAPMAGLAMTGPVFLGFLVFLLVGGMICASLVRFLMCGPGGKGEPPSDLYEIAYLAGGGVRVLQTVLVGLHAAKCVYVYPGKEPFVKRVRVPEQALHDVEVLVWGLLPEDGATVSLGDLQRGLHSAFEKMETGLRKRGLHSPAATTAAWAGLAVLLVAPLAGLIRIITGMANDRPVAGLIVLTLVGLVVAGLAFSHWRKLKRSRRGNAVLKEIRNRQIATGFVRKKINPALVPIGTAAALFGPAILSAYGYADLEGSLQKTLRDSGGGCGTSCGSGCGGDGCGGGGCGGCGD